MHRLIIMFITTMVAVFVLAVDILPGEELDTGAWMNLVMELRKQENRLDKNDRRFLAYMANWLDTEEMPPTLRQQRWLLDIKRRLDQRR